MSVVIKKWMQFENRSWSRVLQKRLVSPGAQVEVPLDLTAARKGVNAETDVEPQITYDKPLKATQAERIIARFGGARRLMHALNRVGRPRNAASIYKWLYPYPKGRGGLVPTSAWRDIMEAARHEGIVLTAEDITPSSMQYLTVDELHLNYRKLDGQHSLTKQIDANGANVQRVSRKYRKGQI